MKQLTVLTLATIALLSFAVALPTGEALAQQKQKVTYKASAANTKYTQQHTIDVGDVPGHQVRIFEIHRTFPTDAPVINGVKLKEMWTRGTSDHADYNGPTSSYSVYVLENGDNFRVRTSTLGQAMRPANALRFRSATSPAALARSRGLRASSAPPDCPIPRRA